MTDFDAVANTESFAPAKPRPRAGQKMAVYTEVTDEALGAFLADYDLGPVSSFKGIAEGVNTFNGVLTYGAVAAAQKREWQAIAKLV